MSVLLWNCRGAASGRLARTLKALVHKHSIKLVAIFEPRASGDRAVKLAKSLGYDKVVVEEAQGFSGGIWLFWCSQFFKIETIEQSNQFVHVKIIKNGELFFFLTAIYASPHEEKRKLLWQDLRRLSSQFAEVLDDCKVIDLGGAGAFFTWQGPKWGHLDRIFKRLDRVCANEAWRLKFTDANIRVLPRIQSDHNPLLLELHDNHNSLGARPFRFVAAWQQHPMFNQFLDEHWKYNDTCSSMLNRLVPPLKQWNINVYVNIWQRKKGLLNSIDRVQHQRMVNESHYLAMKENKLQEELTSVLEQEELLWFQKSREKWIVDGDRNTKFYHLKKIIRRSTNKILRLKNEMQM
ncbi:uncharacterized protein LOC133283886 [Gastrolobium bilobum]|uniref:uncharacterized protein LOC133283886 n=1 Tax=Gastrolobium bilobum TaxID=150636 RepID=UPI002AB240A1|nr:uncharacterized protein LOC133283886 [Gastrolobium bilobum]